MPEADPAPASSAQHPGTPRDGPDLDPAAQALLTRMRSADPPSPNLLRLGELHPGEVGVVEAEVRAIGPVRSYNRKRGGQGQLVRATLADATGQADLVLWDDEVRLVQEGPLQVGQSVRLHGPTVKAGRDGGIELGLGSAQLTALAAAPATTLDGLLLEIGPTTPVGTPPHLRFKAELLVQTKSGPVRVVAWDEAVKQARAAGLGSRVAVEGAPNRLLDGWWTASRLLRNP